MTQTPKPKRKNKRADQARAMGALMKLAKAYVRAREGVDLCSSRIGRATFDLAASLGRDAVNEMHGRAFPLLAASAFAEDAETRQAAWAQYNTTMVWVLARLKQASDAFAQGLAAEARRVA